MLKLFLKRQIKSFCKKIPIKVENTELPVEYSNEIIEKYNSLISTHDNMTIPFVDNKFYKDLFYFSKDVPQSEGLHSWDILFNFIKHNIDTLEREFLIEILQQYSRIDYKNFEFWYLLERRLTKEIKILTNNELAISIYSFGHVMQGSDYIFTQLSQEVLNRGVRKFSQDEFVMIYNGMKNSRIKDKLLWAILDKGRETIFPNI
jgi:hypothetical protein